MKAGPKAVVLVAGAYVPTVGIAVVLAVAILAAMSPRVAAQASRTLVVLLVVLAGEFLISAAAVTLVVARLELALWVRIATPAIYVVGLLLTYVVFGLALGLGLNS